MALNERSMVAQIGILKLKDAKIAVYFPLSPCTEKNTSANDVWFSMMTYGPSLGIFLFRRTQAPNNNNCILVKKGRVGYNIE